MHLPGTLAPALSLVFWSFLQLSAERWEVDVGQGLPPGVILFQGTLGDIWGHLWLS